MVTQKVVYYNYIYIFVIIIFHHNSSGLNISFTGCKIGIKGAAKDGAKYYEVQSKDDEITGCYEKINFHSVHDDRPGRKYPIYNQTGGPFYLKINAAEKGAPWFFLTENRFKYK